MSDKRKEFAVPTSKVTKPKRPSTVSGASTTSRAKIPSTTVKDKNAPTRTKISENASFIGAGDVSMIKQDSYMPNFDAEHRQIAYGKFLRAMLEECFVDDKIERDETQMDVQMAQLADRFQKTVDMLDKTNRRLKDVSFVVEQKRLLDLKTQDCKQFYETTDLSNAQELLNNLNKTEQACLDKLQTKNINFGYDKDSGHKKLLDAVNDALEGLQDIKKHSNLDTQKFEEYDKSRKTLEQLEKDRLDFDTVKADFEEKFPKFNEKLLKEASEKIAKMIENFDD